VIYSSNLFTSIIALALLTNIVTTAFLVQTYYPNPIAQQIIKQKQMFEEVRRALR
jgi:hypothetical protein